MALLGLALLLRLAFWWTVDIGWDAQPHDAKNYVAMVRQWLEDGVYGYMSEEPNAYVTPGYPAFLALVFALFGAGESTVDWVRFIQAVVSALTVIWIYDLGRRLAGRATGAVAGLLFALYTPSIWSTGSVLTETLYVFLLFLYLSLQERVLSRPSPAAGAAAGLALASCVMVRPSAAVLGLIPTWMVFRDWRHTHRLPEWAMAGALGLLVVMLPWWIRNIIVLDRFVLLATQTGNPLLAGTDPFFMDPGSIEGFPPEDQLRVALERIVQGFATQPALYLHWFTLGKTAILLGAPYWGGIPNGAFLAPLSALHKFIVILGLTGLLRALVSPRWRRLVVAFILLLGVQLLFVPDTRYGFPLVALLILPAAEAVVTIARGSRDEHPVAGTGDSLEKSISR